MKMVPHQKKRKHYLPPWVLGGVAALIHLLLIGGILLPNSSSGSWNEVLAFMIDFPISIAFVWLSQFVSLILLHMTIGSVWWFAIVWTITKGLMWIANRAGRSGL